jgi:hypothetical protein
VGTFVRLVALVWMVCLLSSVGSLAMAADSVTGTFTVQGKTTLFKQVYVTRTSNPAEPGSKYLVVLVTDVPVAAADQKPARLFELAKAAKLRAVRILWKEGFDSLSATPFHNAVEDNGQPTSGGAVIDLRAYNEQKLDAKINSKALGQEWHFNATLNAAVVPVTSTADDFAAPVPVVAPTGIERDPKTDPVEPGVSKTPPKDATALKRTLGRHGYEYTGEAFTQAVKDGKAEAVSLFLQIGMSPDTKDDQGSAVLLSAAMMCTNEPVGARLDVVKLLLAAKAAVDPKDGNGSTPLLWSVNSQCSTEIVRALVAAGANVNVKAKGGGTPMMLAKVFQRADVVELLRKAGAKE